MASRLTKSLIASGFVAAAAGGYFIYNLMAAQGQGLLAQAPLNTQLQVTPAFVMVTDDSGSMMFQNQFPGADGKACWNRDNNGQPYSFFYTTGNNRGNLRESGGTCSFAYSYGAHYRLSDQNSNSWTGIPPVDTLGFARSSEYNPAYFDPSVAYLPWLDSRGASYPNVTSTAAPVDPSGNVTSATVNLTVDRLGTSRANGNGNISDKFRAMVGMVLPQGTVYQTVDTLGCGGLTGLSLGLLWHQVSSSAGHTMTASCDVYISHYLPTFYLREDTPVPDGYSAVPRTLVNNACGAGCNMYRYTIRTSDTAAMQNFANWFSYYGNRHKSLIAGLTRSMDSINNMRVGHFRISQHGSFDTPTNSANKRVYMRDLAVQGDKDALYTSFLAGPSWSSTFNRQAVYSAGEQFKRDDALGTARGGAPVQLACQRNAVMLFTDGYSNGGGPTVGNVDGTLGAPFSDLHSNTMADIATRYYANANGASPIRPDLPSGSVPVSSACPSNDPRVNCQSNLHVNFYGVTLSGRGNLYDPENVLDPYTDPSIYQNWPAREDDSRSTIDDIWHATVNTRGEFINARTPADITAAMRRILSSVTAGSSPSGSLAVSGARVGQGSLAVTPQYEVTNEGTDWFSRLIASSISVNASTGAIDGSNIWEAGSRIPAYANRRVFYANGGAVSQYSAGAISLASLCAKDTSLYPGMSRCSAAEINALRSTGVDAEAARRYLLGDTSLEKRNGGPFRDRTNALGDIVNSTPVVSAPTDDYGYRSFPSANGGGASGVGSYGAYLETKKSRRYMVYVGANDGMFHAFDGGMNASGEVVAGAGGVQGGDERFAYMPATAIGHLGNLLFPYDLTNQNDQKFSHRYYVDGPVTVGDARYGSNWNTVAVATSGAGGRSVFALDVSAPGSFGTGSRLWEISDLMTGNEYAGVRANIGHVLGRPVIAPVKATDGSVAFKAIFGNGYNSANGKAVLFVVELGTGSPKVQMLEAEETGSTISGTNGLGNIVVVDRWAKNTTDASLPANNLDGAGSDGFADTVYAADQKGAIWKFDLRAPVAVNQSTPTKQQTRPLFTSAETTSSGSTYRQPITGGMLATAGPSGGVMLYFGTGSFSFTADPGDRTIQSLYAIIDPIRGAPTSSFAPITPSNLVARTISGTSNGARTITTGAAPASSRGWRLTLPAGERFVGYPSIASGVVFLPTYAPQDAASGCSTQGFNWLYGLNAVTGAAAFSAARSGSTTGAQYADGTAAIALDTGGSSPVRDVGVLALPRTNQGTGSSSGSGIEDGSSPSSPPSQGCWMAVTVAGAATSYLPYPCGRQSWRQIQ